MFKQGHRGLLKGNFKTIDSSERDMGATKKRGRPIASRHLVCGTCSSWLQFDTLGCTIPWAEMKGSTVFKCKGYTEVARLVGEVEDLRKMVGSLKRMVTGQGLEETSGEIGDREATLKEAEDREKCVGETTTERSSSEDRDNDIEMEGEHGTEEEETGRQLLDGKGLRPGTQMLATHSYKKNPNGPVGNELDLMEGDTLVYLMEHDNNESWWLAEDGKGEVGYVPATYLMIILDETLHEEESRKEGHEKRPDGTKIGRKMGQDGERRKTYSGAVIDGCERTSTISVADPGFSKGGGPFRVKCQVAAIQWGGVVAELF